MWLDSKTALKRPWPSKEHRVQDIQTIEVDPSGFGRCTTCNFLDISQGLLAGVATILKNKTPMTPPTTTLMLGHAAELLVKVRLLEDHDVQEQDLWKQRERFGHWIGKMWRDETSLFQEAENLWRASDVELKTFGDDAFNNCFGRLEAMHQHPFLSRYGGENLYPSAEPLLSVFLKVFEDLEGQHRKK